MILGGAIEIGQQESHLRHGDTSLRVDRHALHSGAVQHERAGADGAARDIVAPAFD